MLPFSLLLKIDVDEVIMKIKECIACEFHVEHVSDSILCRYNTEIEHRVLSGTDVVACPLNIKKKGFLGLLKKS